MVSGDVIVDDVDGDYSKAGWLFESDDDGKVFSVAVGIVVFDGNVVSVVGGNVVGGDVVIVVMIMIVEVGSCSDQMIVTLLVSLVMVMSLVCCRWMLTMVILW